VRASGGEVRRTDQAAREKEMAAVWQ